MPKMSGCRSPTAPNGSAGCATNRFCFSPGNKLQIPNSKLQRSTRSQPPNTKLQTPEKLQAPSYKLEARAAVWSLELGISLVFGAWILVFRFRNFSGAWGAWCFARRWLKNGDAPIPVVRRIFTVHFPEDVVRILRRRDQ